MKNDPTWLPTTGFLADASDGLVSLLKSLAREVKLAKGEVLFEKGDGGDALYAIVSGSLEFSILSMEGRKLSMDIMRSGALFGEIALFDPGPRTATVMALEPSLLRSIRHSDLMGALEVSPELGRDMIRLAGQRMRWISSQLHEQVFLPVPARLARKILYLMESQAEVGNNLSVSQSGLAEFVGATREAVSKTLSGWKRHGLIEASRGSVKVLNKEALQNIADFQQI